MMWDDWDGDFRLSQNGEDRGHEARQEEEGQRRRGEEEHDESSHFDFDLSSLIPKPKNYYHILEVDYDATEEVIRSNFIRLALKWHPDKQKGEGSATSRFQEINEAYQVLIDPEKRQEYDINGLPCVQDSNIADYLNRYKGLILTCNGLGMKHYIL
ncbi:unnamed protein product [Cuscuta campestris]|uniref:J domain-containing protein n=2 Tax=Cuscuta sect. Cleistogrammica TaxID=1824901 RepID=A0A484LCZ1_9ASTE|nr:hypothetical protein DM860_017099 [Cuscuta australis]VFQ74233.1 unnamed protein product [Cuscuta campestris]